MLGVAQSFTKNFWSRYPISINSGPEFGVTAMAGNFEILETIFKTELADPGLDLTPETVLADIPGWDSVNLSCVILGVETRFGITMTPAQMDRLDTVGDFLALIPDH
jgi:acyl carrier protein